MKRKKKTPIQGSKTMSQEGRRAASGCQDKVDGGVRKMRTAFAH